MFGFYRTFLALLVVVLHLGGIPKVGAYAVFGFYCLSGYLMTLIMQTSYGYSRQGLAKYTVNRFLRIFPLYWFSVSISLLLIFVYGSEHTSGYHFALYTPETLYEGLRNFLLFFPLREVPRLTPPAWALTVELFFYFLIGIGLSKDRNITLVWFILSVVYHCVALIFNFGWEQRYFTILAASLPFSAGALVYHYKNQLDMFFENLITERYKYLPFVAMALILLNWLLGQFFGLSDSIFFYTNFILCTAMIPLLANTKELPWISRRLDKWIGDFSYPIYLIHYQAGLVSISMMAYIGIHVERPNIYLMLFSLPLILLASWLMTYMLERPIDIIRTKIKTS